MSAPNAPSRYHGLDSLRAVMMLLGIYLHAVVAYSNTGGWPYKDEASLTDALNVSLGVIHSFRMPVFFVMAGFFAALLYLRRGARSFAENRARRVLVPFVAGWVLLFPTVAALSMYGRLWRLSDPVRQVWKFVTSSRIMDFFHPMHLWFLEYLILFYAMALAANAVAGAIPAAVREAWKGFFRAVLESAWRPLVFAIPTYLTLIQMSGGGLDDPPGFMPTPRIVLAYLVFFAFGWFLYRNVDLLPTCQRYLRTQLTVCVLAIPFSMWYEHGWDGSHNTTYYVRAGYHAIFVWCLVFALIGVFQRYLGRPIARMRYLSDASYFLYIVHMPVFLVIQLVLARFAWPALVKCSVLLAAGVPVMLFMYDWLARPTFIGATLNGRRYPRQLLTDRAPAELAASPASQ